jgi:hypothetical protein
MEIIFIHFMLAERDMNPRKKLFPVLFASHTMNIDIYGILIPFIYCLRVKEKKRNNALLLNFSSFLFCHANEAQKSTQ